MARLRDAANIWSTIKELDVGEIRDEAEQPVRIALVGAPGPERDSLTHLLLRGARRFPSKGVPPIDLYDIPLIRERSNDLGYADLLILAVPGATPLSYDSYLAFEKLSVLPVPLVLVVLGGSDVPRPAEGVPHPHWHDARTVILEEQESDAAQARLAEAVVEALPEDLRVAASRRLPGLRKATAASLFSGVALSNATYSLTSGIPEMIPVLNLPLNAADMLVLTKNQAIMAYRIGLAMGSDTDFSAMIKELLPVIGGGFLWRQLARQLVGLVPGVGLLPKVAVAYAGTYATGVIASRWFETGELINGQALRQVMKDALEDGRERARALIRRRAKEATADKALPAPTDEPDASTEKQAGLLQRTFARVKELLPGEDAEETEATTPPSSPDEPTTGV